MNSRGYTKSNSSEKQLECSPQFTKQDLDIITVKKLTKQVLRGIRKIRGIQVQKSTA